MSCALVLRSSSIVGFRPDTTVQPDIACQSWLVYVGDVMLDYSRTSDLRTREEALRPFRLFQGAYAVPVED